MKEEKGAGKLRKKGWYLGVCLVLLGLLAGGAVTGIAFRSPGHIPPLKVTGDVANVLTIQDPDSLGRLEKITSQGTRYRAAKLADIIAKAGPPADAGQIHLVGLDGFAPAIKAADINDCYIAFTSKNGWEAVNPNHPNSSNTKFLTEIVVVAEGGGNGSAFNVINRETDLAQITPGQLLTRPLTLYPYAEGKAVAHKDGKDYEAQVFTRRRVFKISELTPLVEGDLLLVTGEKGEHLLADDSGYFEVKDNYINYLQPDTRTKLERVKGVIVQPPAASITDAYYDGRRYLESGDQVLLVVLDGLTYRQYGHAVANGYAPFLNNAGKAAQACGVYPSESNVALAALLTGKAPEENGVVTAREHTLKEPSIFAEASRLNKKAVFLDVAPVRLNTETEPVILNDENAGGSADDELFAAVLDAMEQGYDLLVLRFHGIEDARERYGPLAPETMQAISVTDEYLSEIVSRWPGKVIVTGAQGAGSGAVSGAQESFNSENMFVPYLRFG
jgi:hypothetical protein